MHQNKVIIERLKGLTEMQMQALMGKYKNASLMKQLIGFFKDNQGKAENHDGVKWIYQLQKGEKDYAVYENRFFKLRKKLEEALSEIHESPETYLTEEERQWYEARMLIRRGKHAVAYKLLQTLSKNCEELNIYEFLPDIYDQMIYCNQVFNQLKDNASLYVRLEQALAHRNALDRLRMLSRRLYEINFTKGIEHAVNELEEISCIAERYSDIPRFKLVYHFVSAYYKIASKNNTYRESATEIAEHLNIMHRLHDQYPALPAIIYGPNYINSQHVHFEEIRAFYHYNRLEFEAAEPIMSRLFKEATQNESSQQYGYHEVLFLNTIHVQHAAGKYEEAITTAKKYVKYLQDNKKLERQIGAYAELANVYASLMGDSKEVDPNMLIRKLQEALKDRKNSDEAWLRVSTLVLRLYLIQDDMQKAATLIKKILTKTDYANKSYINMLRILIEKQSIQELKSVKEESEKKLKDSDNPSDFMRYRWINEYIARKSKRK